MKLLSDRVKYDSAIEQWWVNFQNLSNRYPISLGNLIKFSENTYRPNYMTC